jgi:serine protease Do
MRKSTCLLSAPLLLAGFAAHAAPPEPPALADLAAKVMPAVVSIASTDPVNDVQGGTLGGGSGNGSGGAYTPSGDTPTAGSVLPPPRAEEALGSGFIFDPSGYVLTNNHVIDGAASITVTLQDGTILPATLIGRDTAADLAVLKIDAGHKLPFVTFGNSDKLRVADWVLAIGNPFGLPGSTSAGIVSAMNRDINEGAYDDFIQTDAAINRGNSGGPLFNLQGQVIGVDSAIYSPSGGSIGIGFAIPSAMAMPVAYELKDTGSMTRGWLGVDTQEVTTQIQQLLGLPNSSGALVGGIAGNGPAAGKLQAGDVLVSLAGVPVANPRALLIRTAEIPAGQSAVAQFWRNGTKRQATLTLTVPPAQTADTLPSTQVPPPPVDATSLGLTVAAHPTPAGVSITAVAGDGPAAQAGIVAGDVIEEVSGQTVTTVGALQSQLQVLRTGDTKVATLLVSGDVADGSDPGPRWVPVPIP